MVFSVHYYTQTDLHTYRLSDFINILVVDPLSQWESPEEDIFQIGLFCKNSFRIVGFNIFPTILGQKTKIKILSFFSGKVYYGRNFSNFIFSQKFFQESRFLYISDLFRPRTKIENFDVIDDVIMTSYDTSKNYAVKNKDFVNTYLLTKFGIGMS